MNNPPQQILSAQNINGAEEDNPYSILKGVTHKICYLNVSFHLKPDDPFFSDLM